MSTPDTGDDRDDAVQSFVDTFADSMLALHLGPRLTCGEVTAMARLLASCGNTDAADGWLQAHRAECDDPVTEPFPH